MRCCFFSFDRQKTWTAKSIAFPRSKTNLALGLFQRLKILSKVNVWDPDFSAYPRVKKVRFLRTELHPGECLLLPLGWFHAVESFGDPDLNVALNLFFDADKTDWENRKYMKSFKQTYAQ